MVISLELLKIYDKLSRTTRDMFLARITVNFLKPTEVNILYILERLNFYLYMLPKTITKCITRTLMISKRQSYTYNLVT